MANFIQSMGYSLGKVHTGMIAYLCDLHREGNMVPLTSLFDSLGVTLPRSPVAKREWQSIDLVIFDGESTKPSILIEMKVDDHEHETRKWIRGKEEPGKQTVIYPMMFPDCSEYLYITLGLGDYYRAPHGDRFRWIRLNEFAQALEKMDAAEPIIKDWKIAVQGEVRLHDCVRRNDRSRLADYRTGAWDLCFLGQLKESFEKAFRCPSLDATCKMCGTRPDTILNFGWSRYPIYFEVNYSGRLSLKVELSEIPDGPSRRSVIDEALSHLQAKCIAEAYVLNSNNRTAASKTIASFDIGLSTTGGYFGFAESPAFTIQRLCEVLGRFYDTTL